MHELICSVAFSSIVEPSTVELVWNFASTDSRVIVIPTTVTNDDTIGNIYSTVIQFAYLMEGDEGNYVCSLTVQDTLESNFELELTGKYEPLNDNCNYDNCLCTSFILLFT